MDQNCSCMKGKYISYMRYIHHFSYSFSYSVWKGLVVLSLRNWSIKSIKIFNIMCGTFTWFKNLNFATKDLLSLVQLFVKYHHPIWNKNENVWHSRTKKQICFVLYLCVGMYQLCCSNIYGPTITTNSTWLNHWGSTHIYIQVHAWLSSFNSYFFYYMTK